MSTMTLADQVPAVVSMLADDLMTVSASIEFIDEGKRHNEDTGSRYASVADMHRMRYAISNCAAASEAIVEQSGLNLPEVNCTLSIIRIGYKKNPKSPSPLQIKFHYAVIADNEWVLDFTARQFSSKEEFPLVCSLDDWKQTIDSHASRLFSQENGTLRIIA